MRDGQSTAHPFTPLYLYQRLQGWEALEEELKQMRKVQSVRGPKFETMGAHDDLVFALGLALFGVRRRLLPVAGESVRGLVGSEKMRG